MEHALSGCNWNFSAYFNIDGEINFPGDSWAFHIDNADCFDSFNTPAFLDNIN